MVATLKPPLPAILLLLTAATAVLFTGCAPPGPKALLEGEQLIRQGRFPEAIDRLRTARRLLPDEPRVYNFLGLAEHGAGNAAAAVEAYQQALERDRDLAAARYNLGCLLLEHDNAQAAVAELTTFVRLLPDSPEGWLRLGTAHLRNGNLAEADQSFRKAARLSPDHPEALNGLGVIRFHQNRPREAADQFNKILLNHPGYSPALFNLGVIHQSHLVNLPIAFDRYRQYLNSTPNPAHAAEVERIARNLYDRIKQRPATQELVSARSPVLSPSLPTTAPRTSPAPAQTSIAPDPATTLPRESPAQSQSGRPAARPEPAPQQVRNEEPAPRIERPRPQPAPSTTTTTETARSTPAPRSERATPPPVREPVVEPAPTATGRRSETNSPTIAARPPSITATSPGRATNAPAPVRSFRRYEYIEPARPAPGNRSAAEPHFAEGARAQEQREFSRAISAYRQALQSDPAYFDAYYNLGLAALSAGNHPVCLHAFEHALALKPFDPNTRYNFALALQHAGYPLDAAAELNRVLAARPNDTRAHLALGNLHARQLGNAGKAREHYEAVVRLDPQHPEAASIRYWLASQP